MANLLKMALTTVMFQMTRAKEWKQRKRAYKAGELDPHKVKYP